MKNIFIVSILVLGSFLTVRAKGDDDDDRYSDWKSRPSEEFSEAETNFKFVMDKLLNEFLDKKLTKADLYRAATSGMLSTLNKGDRNWNRLLSPGELRELEVDLSGQVTGIGVEMKFTSQTGYAQVLRVLPNSPAQKVGLKKDDQILSVGGVKFKDKQFRDLVEAIRGRVGETVSLKVLREDRILSFEARRDVIPWTPVEFQKLDKQTGLLTIGYFSAETPKLVEESIKEINRSGLRSLVIDVRENSGGAFDQAVRVAELFSPKNTVVVSTLDRDGKIEKHYSSRGLLDDKLQLVVLTNKGTSSGAEFFVASLKDNRAAKIVGETTFGKWNAQLVEKLPNKFAIKFTTREFKSPKGNSYQDVGIRPDFEVAFPKELDLRESRLKTDLIKRLAGDPQLRAALELAQ